MGSRRILWRQQLAELQWLFRPSANNRGPRKSAGADGVWACRSEVQIAGAIQALYHSVEEIVRVRLVS
jgi:hypothetical protein